MWLYHAMKRFFELLKNEIWKKFSVQTGKTWPRFEKLDHTASSPIIRGTIWCFTLVICRNWDRDYKSARFYEFAQLETFFLGHSFIFLILERAWWQFSICDVQQPLRIIVTDVAFWFFLSDFIFIDSICQVVTGRPNCRRRSVFWFRAVNS